ncbi:Methyltransferase [Hoyosella subflava DQS3-9A1]|uniref:Methyltransferase n=1 Tax=Hoyosella subflava (strain DSM 45089 / JCM 17490 / NBRC 109087 / DQS3-9A1) TaxID=443218 RepID=F6EI61_HOYSD|nr:Methyltransferase [Hoyosella subflava DQS3-9A1]
MWGRESHLRELFGAGITEPTFERRTLATPAQITTPAAFREFFKSNYGPTIAVYNSLGAEPGQQFALDQDLERFLTNSAARISDTPARWEMEYTLFTAVRRKPCLHLRLVTSAGGVGLSGRPAVRCGRVVHRHSSRSGFHARHCDPFPLSGHDLSDTVEVDEF